MEIDRRSVLNGLAATTACAAVARLPALAAAPMPAARDAVLLARESVLASFWIESLSRNSSTRQKVDQLWDDLVQGQLAEGGYEYETPRPGGPPNFGRFACFMRLWEGLPLEKQAAIIRKSVASRFETGSDAKYAAAYLLVAFSHDAPGWWYEDKLQWALRALC